MKTDITLYNISQQFLDLEKTLLECGGEINDDKELILEEISGLLQSKVDGCVGFVKKQSDIIIAIEKRIEELQELKTSREKVIGKFSDYVLGCMDIMKKEKLEGEFSKISIRKPPKIVEIVNEDDLPIDCLNIQTVTTKKPDKKLIKDKIESGEEVPGAKISFGQRKVIFK